MFLGAGVLVLLTVTASDAAIAISLTEKVDALFHELCHDLRVGHATTAALKLQLRRPL